MADQFTEVTGVSWISRLIESIKGIAFGFLLLLVGGGLLFWNEGRAVKTAKALTEGASVVVHVESAKVDPANEGKLVHLNGTLEAAGTRMDSTFGISVPGVKLSRTVEMYQWVQTKDSKSSNNVGGSQTTTATYSYNTNWKSSRIDSSEFKSVEGHVNPQAWAYTSQDWSAPSIKAGAFTLSDSLVDQIKTDQKLPADDAMVAALPVAIKDKVKLSNGMLYIANDPAKPAVGDLRISFAFAGLSPVSVVAKQLGSTLTDFTTSNSESIGILTKGTVDAAKMFAEAQAGNTKLTWILRGVGFVVLFIGFAIILQPFVILANVLPFLGAIVGYGTALGAAIAAGSVGLVVVSVAWIAYRPLLGGGLLAAALAILVMAYIKRKKRTAVPAMVGA